MGHAEHDDPYDPMRAKIDSMYQDLFGPSRWAVAHHTHAWRPPTDVFETAEAVVVRIEVPGVHESDFSVSLTERLLIITGFRQDPSPKVAYHQMEVRYGEFRAEVYLHWAIDSANIQAVYENGFLQVILPKARKRQIHVTEDER